MHVEIDEGESKGDRANYIEIYQLNQGDSFLCLSCNTLLPLPTLTHRWFLFSLIDLFVIKLSGDIIWERGSYCTLPVCNDVPFRRSCHSYSAIGGSLHEFVKDFPTSSLNFSNVLAFMLKMVESFYGPPLMGSIFGTVSTYCRGGYRWSTPECMGKTDQYNRSYSNNNNHVQAPPLHPGRPRSSPSPLMASYPSLLP